MEKKKLNILQVIKSVLYAMIGVQKNSNAEKDFLQPGPIAYIIGGIIGVAIFITVLMLIVRHVTG